MYRGFNLEINQAFDTKRLLVEGRNVLRENKQNISDRMRDLITYDGILKGNEVIDKWFPTFDCDIFLSHSHKDQQKAIALAGLFKKEFGLKTFIDSTIWGCSNMLLKIIDDHFCLLKQKQSYSYKKRNNSTAHVHMMLCSALHKMIDNCEAVIFLNTPNSISPDSTIENSTSSPWIFSEIATTQIIRKRIPRRKQFRTKAYMTEGVRGELKVGYSLDLSHLTRIGYRDIEMWIREYKKFGGNSLDVLYNLKPQY